MGKVCFKSNAVNASKIGWLILVDCPAEGPYIFRDDTSKMVQNVGLWLALSACELEWNLNPSKPAVSRSPHSRSSLSLSLSLSLCLSISFFLSLYIYYILMNWL